MNSSALYLAGFIYFFENKLEPALEALQKARNQAPHEGKIHFQLFYVLQKLGRRNEALLSLEEAVRSNPQSEEWRNVLATEYLLRSRYDEARLQFRKMLEQDPDSFETRLNLGFLYLVMESTQDALEEINKAYQVDPSGADRHFYNLMARNLRPEGLAALIDDIKREAGLAEDGTKAHFNLGKAYLNLDRYNFARQSFVRYLQDHPKDFEGRFQEALALTKNGRWNEATERLEKLCADGCTDKRVLFVLTEAYLKQNLPDEAQEMLDTFIGEDSPANVHHLQGMAHTRKGKLDLALESFESTLRKDPEFVEAYYWMGQILRQKKDLERSREHLTTYQRLKRLQENRSKVRQ